jgi:5-methylcytosine-specific restriction endonuclease McrA
MPNLTRTSCRPGCPNSKPCPIHGKQKDTRKSSAKRGYDGTWRKLRAAKLAKDPISECTICPIKSRCRDFGKTFKADTVHHIKPVSKYPRLRLVWGNLMSVARACHERIEERHG